MTELNKVANKQGSWRIDSKRADKAIKFCTICKRCYEELLNRRWQAESIVHYSNFPSYKKEKKTCLHCKRKGIQNEKNKQ